MKEQERTNNLSTNPAQSVKKLEEKKGGKAMKYEFEKELAKGQTMKDLIQLEYSKDPIVSLNARYQGRYLDLRNSYQKELILAEFKKYILDCPQLNIYIENPETFKHLDIDTLFDLDSDTTIKLIKYANNFSWRNIQKRDVMRRQLYYIHRDIPVILDEDIIFSTYDHDASKDIKDGIYFYQCIGDKYRCCSGLDVKDQFYYDYNRDSERENSTKLCYQIIENGIVVKQGVFGNEIPWSSAIRTMVSDRITKILKTKKVKKEETECAKLDSEIIDEVWSEISELAPQKKRGRPRKNAQ